MVSLRLKGNNLTRISIIALSETLRNTNINNLDLSNNKLSADCLEHLLTIRKNNKKLKTIILKRNGFGSKDQQKAKQIFSDLLTKLEFS